MKFEKRVYSKQAIFKGIQTIDNFQTTTKRKQDHMVKVYELENMFNKTLYTINDALFSFNYNPDTCKYSEMVKRDYYTSTKNSLDHCLKLTLLNSKNLLYTILNDCDAGYATLTD